MRLSKLPVKLPAYLENAIAEPDPDTMRVRAECG